jgi:hypothetical protein
LLSQAGSIFTFFTLPSVTLPLLLVDNIPVGSITTGVPPLFSESTNSFTLLTRELNSWASKVSPVFLV